MTFKLLKIVMSTLGLLSFLNAGAVGDPIVSEEVENSETAVVIVPELPSFSDEAWAGIPIPGELTTDDIIGILEGGIEKNGHLWKMVGGEKGFLKPVVAVIGDEAYTIHLRRSESYIHEEFAFRGDTYKSIKYALLLRSKTQFVWKPVTDSNGRSLQKHLPKTANLWISTDLSDEEVENPIIRYLNSLLSGNESDQDVKSTLLFVKPECRESFLREMVEYTHE